MNPARTNIQLGLTRDAAVRCLRAETARATSSTIVPTFAAGGTVQRAISIPRHCRPLVLVLLLLFLMKCSFVHALETNAPVKEETNAPVKEETNAPAKEETNAPAKEETNAPAREETNASAPKQPKSRALKETNARTRLATNAPALDYSSFKIIAERNIFNLNRSARSARGGGPLRRAAKVETISLVGTLSSENGRLAFFDSSSSQYKKVLKPAGTIAGFTIKDIALNHVTLEAGGKVTELRVGMRIRREDGGEWRVSEQTESLASGANQSATPADAAGSASDDEDNDVLKKLLQKREEELNK